MTWNTNVLRSLPTAGCIQAVGSVFCLVFWGQQSLACFLWRGEGGCPPRFVFRILPGQRARGASRRASQLVRLGVSEGLFPMAERGGLSSSLRVQDPANRTSLVLCWATSLGFQIERRKPGAGRVASALRLRSVVTASRLAPAVLLGVRFFAGLSGKSRPLPTNPMERIVGPACR